MGQLILIEKWAENLEEVTLSRWLKQVGDVLAAGDSLCELITDKMTFEYEMQEPGILRHCYFAENSVLPVGCALAFVGEAQEPLPESVEARNRELLEQHRAKSALDLDFLADVQRPTRPARPDAPRPVRATPAGRRIARENGVTVEQVAASLGPREVISEADVAEFLAARAGES